VQAITWARVSLNQEKDYYKKEGGSRRQTAFTRSNTTRKRLERTGGKSVNSERGTGRGTGAKKKSLHKTQRTE